jgi:hypothetical protein
MRTAISAARAAVMLVFIGSAPPAGAAVEGPAASVSLQQAQGRGQQGRDQQGRGQERRERPRQTPAQQAAPARERPEQAQPGRGRTRDRPDGARPDRGQAGERSQQGQATPQRGRPEQAPAARQAPGRSGEPRGGARNTPGHSGEAPGHSGEAPGSGEARGRSGEALGSPDAARGRSGAAGPAAAARSGVPGRRSPTADELSRRLGAMPVELQAWATSHRRGQRLVAGALVHAAAWGLEPDRLEWHQQGDHAVVTSRRGDVLVRLDDRHARDLGFWEVRRLGDRRPRGNAPAFCRSGAGHPVWGREWCLDRGFGLGSRAGTIWSRGLIDDVLFRRTADRGTLTRDALLGIVGEVVVNRLALHALSMGFTEPVHGVWIAEPASPRILHVYAGDVVIAELVDVNRTDRPDVIYVLQPL